MHDFLPLFVLAHILIDPLVHGSLRLWEPEKHVRVIFHLHYETRRGIRENMERHLLIKYKVVFSIGQWFEDFFDKFWVDGSYEREVKASQIDTYLVGPGPPTTSTQKNSLSFWIPCSWWSLCFPHRATQSSTWASLPQYHRATRLCNSDTLEVWSKREGWEMLSFCYIAVFVFVHDVEHAITHEWERLNANNA